MGHLIHLVRNEFAGCRMRSRFWLGDVEGVEDPHHRAASVPPSVTAGFVKRVDGNPGVDIAGIIPVTRSKTDIQHLVVVELLVRIRMTYLSYRAVDIRVHRACKLFTCGTEHLESCIFIDVKVLSHCVLKKA
jgi:hypothetical protein